ncbi:MAG TPA: ThuA domain-containing protein, partial [Gemmataceae bacterium]
MKRLTSLFAALTALALACEAAAAEKIRVLIIDGQNNHNWEDTTPYLKEQLEKTGRFTVSVSTTPPTNPNQDKATWAKWDPDFSKVDVVLSNYNGPAWPEHVRTKFEKFMRDGGGLVNVHAANNAHQGWDEFEKMTGLLWRGPKGGWRVALDERREPVRVKPGEGPGAGHGPQHAYPVVITDSDHPITKGMPQRWMHVRDELYHGQRGPAEEMHI